MTDQLDVRTSLSLGRDAVVVVELGDLLDEQGVPLPLEKGAQLSVIVMPSPACDHAAARPVPPVSSGKIKPAFDTAEHAIIVSGLKLQTETGFLDPVQAGLPIGTSSSFKLTYGQIVALGGDFFGDPDNPVCTSSDPQGQFAKNFNTMTPNQDQIVKILAIANKYEFAPIGKLPAGWQPSGVYAGLPTTGPHFVSDEDRAFDEATGGTSIKNGRYLNLAATNFDHFGLDAVTCYRAGHAVAQQQAVNAKKISDPTSRASALLLAYAINAFADHFLTDLFAAGHMRTPRRALYESAWNGATRLGAGLCAKQMHDEDNKFGVWVSNAVGDTWVAYGDARYRDTLNAASRVIMKAAVQQSMNDVWASFSANPPAVADGDASGVLRYTANVIRDITDPKLGPNNRDDTRNWAPLFWRNPADGNVWRRNALFDPSDRTFCKQGLVGNTWGITSTVAQLASKGFPVYMPQSVYRGNFPPSETGMTGEYGWPPRPGSMTGAMGASGPTLRATSWAWAIDGATGATQPPLAAPSA